jgi:creatinine amidohydrolase
MARVREAAALRLVIVVPVAAIEQHGYHLPVDTDDVLVEQVTEEAAWRSERLLLTAPMIHCGFDEHNMDFPGSITVRETVFIYLCYDIAHSFVHNTPYVEVRNRITNFIPGTVDGEPGS